MQQTSLRQETVAQLQHGAGQCRLSAHLRRIWDDVDLQHSVPQRAFLKRLQVFWKRCSSQPHSDLLHD